MTARSLHYHTVSTHEDERIIVTYHNIMEVASYNDEAWAKVTKQKRKCQMYYKDTDNHGNMSMSSVWNDRQVFLAIGLPFELRASYCSLKMYAQR